MANATTISAKQIATLKARAAAVAANAHAPYSKFFVGAALLLDNGKIVDGCNVENGSYRLTTCAEQTAIVKAVSIYGTSFKVRAVAIALLNRNFLCSPCGACRQTLHEFATDDCIVYFPAGKGKEEAMPLQELLPKSFKLKH